MISTEFPTMRSIAGYGWKPDLGDFRDLVFTPRVFSLPEKVDLSAKFPEVFDQLRIGSCTANAWSAQVAYTIAVATGQTPPDVPSRLFIYYNERAIEGTTGEDSGAYIRDGVKTIATIGVCDEGEWPYDTSKFTLKPPAVCYTDSKKEIALKYMSVAPSDIQSALADNFAVVIGFTVYSSFENIDSTGIMPMPARNESVLGGHAVVVVGYETINGVLYFRCRNSWSKSWGYSGYFFMPAQYLMDRNLASDFWTIELVGDSVPPDPTPTPAPTPVDVSGTYEFGGLVASKLQRDAVAQGITVDQLVAKIVTHHYHLIPHLLDSLIP